MSEHIVIVGASAAGLSTLERLRREGFPGRVTVIGAERRAPYDRPPLTKRFLSGEWSAERTELRTPDALAELAADWQLGVAALGLDVRHRRLRLTGDRTLDYDKLVIATGVRPRTLPGTADLAGVHTLRTLDDALALRTALAGRPRVVVIGAGPLGSEFAATAHDRADSVTLVDPRPAPLHRQLGDYLGGRLATLHTAHGVALRLGIGVHGVRAAAGRVTGVELADGSVLAADLVLIAIGSTPNVDWLADSGIPVWNGVVCDEFCRVTPEIYAAGDVASWYHPDYQRRMRLEHRMNATGQGAAVARNLLGAAEPFAPVPMFWTDHYDTTIQVHGLAGPGAFTVVDGDPAQGRFVGLYGDGRQVTGVLSWNSVRAARTFRPLLGADWTSAHPSGSTAATAN
ncbi:NAD(P)/FAD-dependent oxidoreductase [Crossiella sp. CA198]|uniref:NAD(P)/FAD-dependent oxidoreductase n=1 Tax=Crossiella sp. CA198 TaxID=3455607 RepID=UPI003F8D1278